MDKAMVRFIKEVLHRLLLDTAEETVFVALIYT
jgi:hypothetical protein